ncbi:MAG TPA: hypothetical protein VFW71_12545 [Actinomycetota bacterium]|nr:hypothetical protein [Actinomycetota bacterium]
MSRAPEAVRSAPDIGDRDAKPARRFGLLALLGRSPVLVIVAVAVLLLAAVLAYPHHTPKHTKVKGTRTSLPAQGAVISDLAGYSLVSVGPTGAVTVAPFGDLSPRRTIPNFTASVYPQLPIESGQSVALVADGQAFRVGSPPGAAPALLGTAATVFPSEIDDTVGAYTPGSGSSPATVRTLAVTGTATSSAAIPFPPAYTPVALLSDGFYLVLKANTLQLWDSARGLGQSAMVASYGNASSVIAVSGTQFAWLDAANCDAHAECPLHITDAATGQGSLVAAPPGYAGYLGVGAFDPVNANLLAALVYDPVNNAPGARLALLTRNPRGSWVPVLVPQSSLIPGKTVSGQVAWTPDGGHILFSGGYGPIHDYRLGDISAFETEQPASDAFAVIGKALPAP